MTRRWVRKAASEAAVPSTTRPSKACPQRAVSARQNSSCGAPWAVMTNAHNPMRKRVNFMRRA